jgi:hypothetical protein
MYMSLSRAVLVVLLLASGVAGPAHAAPGAQQTSATLTVISGQVQVAPPGGGFAPGSSGQTVAVGARVRTSSDGRGTLTFFDGTTATLDPDTELTLSNVQPSGGQGGLLMNVGLTVGRVWAQVTSLVDRGSSFEVQAGGTTAAGREGATGYRLNPDGTLVCWVIDGAPMKLRTPAGEIELLAGQQVTLPPGGGLAAPAPRAFAPGVLEVQTEGAVLARLVDPANLTVGFPLADFAVNQILDATTSLPQESTRWIRVPGPAEGVHRLVLQSFEGGPYRVRVALTYEGRELLAREWSATARPNEHYIADLTVIASGGVPSTGLLDEPKPLVGEAPGTFIYP